MFSIVRSHCFCRKISSTCYRRLRVLFVKYRFKLTVLCLDLSYKLPPLTCFVCLFVCFVLFLVLFCLFVCFLKKKKNLFTPELLFVFSRRLASSR